MNTKKKRAACPLCGRDRDVRFRPFCSPRCRDLDLSRWLDGSYAVPVVEDDQADFSEEEPTRLFGSRLRSDENDD